MFLVCMAGRGGAMAIGSQGNGRESARETPTGGVASRRRDRMVSVALFGAGFRLGENLAVLDQHLFR